MTESMVTVVGGIIFGGVLVCAVAWVYIKHQKLAAGGAFLALVGFGLIGISVWTHASFEFGTLKANFARVEAEKQELASKNVELNDQNSELSTRNSKLDSVNTQLQTDLKISQQAFEKSVREIAQLKRGSIDDIRKQYLGSNADRLNARQLVEHLQR